MQHLSSPLVAACVLYKIGFYNSHRTISEHSTKPVRGDGAIITGSLEIAWVHLKLRNCTGSLEIAQLVNFKIDSSDVLGLVKVINS